MTKDISKSSTVVIIVHDSRGQSVVSPSQSDVPSSTISPDIVELGISVYVTIVTICHLSTSTRE